MFCEILEPKKPGNFAVAIAIIRGFFSKQCEYLTDLLDTLLFSDVRIKGSVRRYSNYISECFYTALTHV